MDLPLRPLLLDCRMELRKLVRNFDKTELCARLDAAMTGIAQEAHRAAQATISERTSTSSAPPAPTDLTSQQIAYAWQSACRTLKTTHPEVHEQLHAEVLRLLDDGHYADPAGEIADLRHQVAEAEQDAQALKLAKMKLQAQLLALQKALASAWPEAEPGSDPQAIALQRISALANRAASSLSAGPGSLLGDGAARAGVSFDAVPPPPQLLELVKAGERSFSKAQREFAVGEALVVTGWQFTPVELLEKGEPWLAGLLLERSASR